MSDTPQHWAHTTGGSAKPGNEDAYVWLGPDDLGAESYLWLVIDGEGGDGVGDLASGMFAITVREIYDDLLDMHGSPLAALDIAAEEAATRLASIASVYPNLAGARASFAAVALHHGKVYTAMSGTAAVFCSHYGTLTRIGEDDIARTVAGDGDMDPIPGSGIRADGPLMRRGETFDEPEGRVFLLASDGVTSMVPEPLLAQAAARLGAKDCAEGLVELARERWSDDDATAISIRFPSPIADMLTSKQAYLDWAATGMTKWPDKTLVLQVSKTDTSVVPPASNVVSLPPIEGTPTDSSEVDVVASTMAFSPDQVAAIVSASAGSKPSAVTAAPSRPPSTGTMAFSPAELAQIRAAGPPPVQASPTSPFADTAAFSEESIPGPPEPAAAQTRPPVVGDGSGTLVFSPEQMAQVRGETQPPRVTTADPPVVAPASEPDSTLFFSPSQAEEIRAAAQVAQPRTGDFPRTAQHPQTADFGEEPPRRMPNIARASTDELETRQRAKLETQRSKSWVWALVFVVLAIVALVAVLVLR